MTVTDQLPSLEKLVGTNRYETAVKISKRGWPTSDTIFLVNGWAIADGLTATPLASSYDAPILLTTKDTIPLETLEEIKRLQTRKVVLIGGTGVISTNVENTLRYTGIETSRIGGKTRYETSLLIAQELDKKVDVHTIYMAYGYGEPDALSIAAQSGSSKQPIILTTSETVPGPALNWLKNEGLQSAYFIGGATVIKPTVISTIDSISTQNVSNNRLSGKNRHETNAKVIDKFYSGSTLSTIMVANSDTAKLVDALAAGPLAAKLNVPVLLVSNTGLNQMQKSTISGKQSHSVLQVGGGIQAKVLDDIVTEMN